MKLLMPLLFFFICYIPTLITIAATPYLTRKTESFGVTIPEGKFYSREISKIRTHYRNNVLLFGGILSFLAFILILVKPNNTTFTIASFGTVLLVVIMLIFYFQGHKKVKALKETNDWTADKVQRVIIDTSFRNSKVIASPMWFLLYLAVIISTAALGFIFYDRLPNRIPIHYDANGNINGWAHKSYGVILFAPFTQIFISIVMVLSYWVIGKSKQALQASNPMKSSKQNKLFRYRWSLFSIISGLTIMVMIGIMQLCMCGIIKNSALMTVMFFIVAGSIAVCALFLSIKTGQGGNRINIKSYKENDSSGKEIMLKDDDKYWKLGLFYFNPKDPSSVVEKRFGVGWTINFGRPIAWIISAGLIAVTIIFIVISNILVS